MRAMLVIEMPHLCCSSNKTCAICVDTDWGHICAKTGRDVLWEQKPPDWCPLRPLPEREDDSDFKEAILKMHSAGIEPEYWDGFTLGRIRGWNACLDAITGGAR